MFLSAKQDVSGELTSNIRPVGIMENLLPGTIIFINTLKIKFIPQISEVAPAIRVPRDIEAEIININGRGKTLGKVKCNNLEVNGSFNSYDDISIYEIGEVNGYYEVNGNEKE